jgi:hypothetical protein
MNSFDSTKAKNIVKNLELLSDHIYFVFLTHYDFYICDKRGKRDFLAKCMGMPNWIHLRKNLYVLGGADKRSPSIPKEPHASNITKLCHGISVELATLNPDFWRDRKCLNDEDFVFSIINCRFLNWNYQAPSYEKYSLLQEILIGIEVLGRKRQMDDDCNPLHLAETNVSNSMMSDFANYSSLVEEHFDLPHGEYCRLLPSSNLLRAGFVIALHDSIVQAVNFSFVNDQIFSHLGFLESQQEHYDERCFDEEEFQRITQEEEKMFNYSEECQQAEEDHEAKELRITLNEIFGDYRPGFGFTCIPYVFYSMEEVEKFMDIHFNQLLSLWGRSKKGELSVFEDVGIPTSRWKKNHIDFDMADIGENARFLVRELEPTKEQLAMHLQKHSKTSINYAPEPEPAPVGYTPPDYKSIKGIQSPMGLQGPYMKWSTNFVDNS